MALRRRRSAKLGHSVEGCPAHFDQCVVVRVCGGTVPRIEGRSEMERIQFARRGRSSVRSPSPRLRAISTATAMIRCAMQGDPASPDRLRGAQRNLPCAVRALLHGQRERSFSGRAISRPHTAMPSHMLRAANSNRRYPQSDACDALWKRGLPSSRDKRR
jgi:hypothetical protein